MKRRSTWVHSPSLEFNPNEVQVYPKQLLYGAIKSAREERLTFGFDELPRELWEVLQHAHELHIRWAPEQNYNTTAPFLSRLSPGLHVHYTPLESAQHDMLCPLLHKVFSEEIKCESTQKTFISPAILSERFTSSSSLQYYSILPSAMDLVGYIQRNICPHSDLTCIHTVSLINIADYFDIDYDSISHTFVVTVFWSKAPEVIFDPIGEFTTYNHWQLAVEVDPPHTVEVGILSSLDASDPHDLQMSGFLTVVGEDDHPKPTLFSFPSRHHSLQPSQARQQKYTVSFLQPTGLHPTMQISFPSAAALSEPTNKPPGSTCALQTYLTLPSVLFADENVFGGNDPLFQASHQVRIAHSISGEKDLEAPDYAVSKWGSTMLLELIHPENASSTPPPSTTSSAASWDVTIPLHLRYLPPNVQGFMNVDIPWPVVFWACTAEEGTKFPVNPFDRTQLGYESLFGPRTMFYHLDPQTDTSRNSNGDNRLVETLKVPVLATDAETSRTIELGTLVVIVLGFMWILTKLWPGIAITMPFGKTVEEKTKGKEKKEQ